jgi:hypothetical protein
MTRTPPPATIALHPEVALVIDTSDSIISTVMTGFLAEVTAIITPPIRASRTMSS